MRILIMAWLAAALAPAPPAAAPTSPFERGVQAADRGDQAQATESFRQACDAGEARGCNELGVIYDQGRGVAAALQHALPHPIAVARPVVRQVSA